MDNLTGIKSQLAVIAAMLENIHVRGSMEINMMANVMARVGEAQRLCDEALQALAAEAGAE